MSVDMSRGNENMDYAQHQRTYNLFVTLVKWGGISVAVTLVFMAIFLL